MSLIVRKPGILTTVQDLGRIGARRFGINPNGVMDTSAARVVNILIGNADDAPVLEMHFPAGELEFDEDTAFAIGGADLGAEMDGAAIRNWSTHWVTRGGRLRFKSKRYGQRAYLALPGGIKVDEWLGSASTNLTAGVGGLDGRRLVAGDRIPHSGTVQFFPFTAGNSIAERYAIGAPLRVIPGSEFEFLTATSERSLLSGQFTLTNDCNRMGYRLKGEPLHLLHAREMVSAAVSFGSIQLLPDGQLIVLMADHQTAGGYPRIANVVSADLPILAQCGPGDRISFDMVSIGEAETLASEFERELNYLRVGCRLQTQNANR